MFSEVCIEPLYFFLIENANLYYLEAKRKKSCMSITVLINNQINKFLPDFIKSNGMYFMR